MVTMFVLGWLSVADVYADDTANKAEYERILGEMTKLSKTNAWLGVDKRFDDLESLGMTIEFDHYILGAQAAQEIGDLAACKERLHAALEQKRKKSVEKWYDQIDQEYGNVVLIANSKGQRDLQSSDIMMDPIKAQALSFAQAQIVDKGEFTGVLPVGNYNFGGQSFAVTSEIAVHLEISPRLRKKKGSIEQ